MKRLKMIYSMTEEKIFENSHTEKLNGIIKNNYLCPDGPIDLISFRKH